MGGETRLPRERVLPVATSLYRALKPVCEKIMIAGSLRRQQDPCPTASRCQSLGTMIFRSGAVTPSRMNRWTTQPE